MKVPYYCPYCDQTSTWKWNLSTHIKRKYEGQFDPFEIEDKIILTDEYYERKSKSGPDFSNFSLPQIDWTNPIPYKARSINYEGLLTQLRSLNKKELVFLLFNIYNFPQFKRSNSHVLSPWQFLSITKIKSIAEASNQIENQIISCLTRDKVQFVWLHD